MTLKQLNFENKKNKNRKDIDRLLELYLNEDIPESIRKSSIADKMKEEEALKAIDDVIFELKNKEKKEKLIEERINSLKTLLRSIK